MLNQIDLTKLSKTEIKEIINLILQDKFDKEIKLNLEVILDNIDEYNKVIKNCWI